MGHRFKRFRRGRRYPTRSTSSPGLFLRVLADKGGNDARKPSGDEVQGTTGRRKKISPSLLPLQTRLRQDGDVWERGKVLTPQISINKIPRLTSRVFNVRNLTGKLGHVIGKPFCAERKSRKCFLHEMFNLLSKESHENMFCTKCLIYSR